jgi:hypothetical protein
MLTVKLSSMAPEAELLEQSLKGHSYISAHLQTPYSSTTHSRILDMLHLDLETSGTPATTGLLELAALGLDVWFL